MKITINDQNGTKLIHAINLKGKMAKDGISYKSWTGKYHKNGKWSYQEGGIFTKNLAYSILKGSTHTNRNNCLSFYVVVNDKLVASEYVGNTDEIETRPKFQGEHQELFQKLLSLWEKYYMYDWQVEEWDEAEKFL